MSDSDTDTTVVNSPSHSRPRLLRPSVLRQKRSSVFRLMRSATALALSPARWVGLWMMHWIYMAYQAMVRAVFASPHIPRKPGQRPYGRIAIVGAGLTGISSAAHAVEHGFDVVIFEAGDEVGGIWARENKTSQLQLNSVLYRFHPSIHWSKGFPQRDEIVEQIKGVWRRYGLEEKTRFNYKVTKIQREPDSSTDSRKGGHARWIVNDGKEGIFDAVIGSVGTCGEPSLIQLEGQDSFRGQILHSSQLDDAELAGKKVVIIGSGASGVESAELAVSKGAGGVTVLARSDKWFIPRNTVLDILLSLQPFGREMPLSFIPEWLIRKLHYGALEQLSPAKKGLFEGTPIVNDEFLEHIRQGRITYKRGDTKSIVSRGVKFVERPRGSKSGDAGDEGIERADVLIVATGYKRPEIKFLPDDLFPREGDRDYHPPSLFLQNFSTSDWSVLLTNASYQDAIGSVGNWHIGILTRVLLVFLLDKSTRPSPISMKTWVDAVTWIKKQAWGDDTSGLAFFTYAEMCIWIVLFHLLNPRRLPWFFFIVFGFGVHPGQDSYAEKLKATDASLAGGEEREKNVVQRALV